MNFSKVKDQCRVPFHFVSEQALVAGVFGIPILPSAQFGTRLLNEADAWCHFRVLDLQFRLHPPAAQTAGLAVGYVGGVQDTAPSTVAQVTELLPSTYLGTRATAPTVWVTCSKSELAGPFPWYKSIAGAADATEESPGSIVVVGAATAGFSLELRGEFEFKTSVSTGNTPLSADLRLKIRKERQDLDAERTRMRLIKALATAKLQQ